MRQALSELEQWEVESHWTLAQHVDSNGILLFIIKEFKELLNKVEINIIIQHTPFPNKNIVQTGWREYEPYTVRQGFILLSGIQRPDYVVGNQND